MNRNDFPKNIRGFTLIELLVAIFIITLLASVTLIGIHGVRIKADNVASLKAINEYYWAFKLTYKENGILPWDTTTGIFAGFCLASTPCDTPTTAWPYSAILEAKLAPYVKLGPAFQSFTAKDSGSGSSWLAESPVYHCDDSIADITSSGGCKRGYIEYHLRGTEADCFMGGFSDYIEWRYDNGVQCQIYFPGQPDGCDYRPCL